MTDPADTNEVPEHLQIPPGMAVQLMGCRYCVNDSGDMVWLWLRYPSHVIAQGFDADAAEHLARGLFARARSVREHQAQARLEVAEGDLLGPDGRPAQ